MSGAPLGRIRGPVVVAILMTLILGGAAIGFVGGAVATPTAAAPPASPSATNAASTSLTGSITGPTVLAYNATEFYTLNATGGPAFSSSGVMVGNITYYIALGATNLTGVSMSPTQGAIVNSTAQFSSLTVSNISETVTIHVMISSVYLTENQSINLTYDVLIVKPYALTVNLTAGPNSTVLSFLIDIYLDGIYAGDYKVPTLTPSEVYTISWAYASAPLSSGTHTFTLAIPTGDKGLVTFPNGQSSYSYSFYITGPAPDYTLWIVLGVLAFVAVAFISLILVGGRRRNRGRS
ncbi:MAG: hypothetical protein WAN74_05635 [Thermoplasmata archaeon]